MIKKSSVIALVAFIAGPLVFAPIGFEEEYYLAFAVVAFIGTAKSLYTLRESNDLTDSPLGAIYIQRGRREAFFWGWFIWAFSFLVFLLVIADKFLE